MTAYPHTRAGRDAWILERRPARRAVDPWVPNTFFVEEEAAASGPAATATVFLANRECPWRCLMCDLWRGTLAATVPAGAIAAQIDHALARLPPARQIKLYNSGSFFDAAAIPPGEHGEIAARLQTHERVIVECHPALVGEACARFRALLPGALEVAMGLETAHPEVLARLHKGMTLAQFSAAARRLAAMGVALRVFILVRPPFLGEEEGLRWACRSLDFAFDQGAEVACLIPTRAGNGALEALAERGEFAPPELSSLEAALAYGLGLGRGRVFADLWDLGRFSRCPSCYDAREARLRAMNLRQAPLPPVPCAHCGGGA